MRPTDEHVTIIIPTYNRAKLVGNAIRSALAQDYPHLDVLVVDDGSTDDTAAALAAFDDDPRVRVVWRQANGGVTAAKNSGIDALADEVNYFGILDSDDVLEPGAVSQLMAPFLESDRMPSQVFGWCADSETGEATGHMTTGGREITYEDALCGRFAGEFWQLIRKDLLGNLRFDERAGGNEAMVWWPLLKRAPGVLIDSVVRSYDRSGTDRVSRPTFTPAGADKLMWGYKVLLERVGDEMRVACPGAFADTALEHAKWAALSGNRKEFRTGIRNAWVAYPSIRVAKVALFALLPAQAALKLYSLGYRRTG